MSWYLALALMLGPLCTLLLLGLPVAFAFFVVNVLGAMVFLGGDAGLAQMVRNSATAVANYSLAPIPLFVLMGEILLHSGVAFRAINAIEKLIARVPGRLPIVSVVGGTVFAALSGSSLANTAMLGSALLPDMFKRGYEPKISMGPIMATGGIAMLIPPSALAVLLGSLAGMSISKLLIAGIVPALMLAVLFIGYIVVACIIDPSRAPRDDGPVVAGWARYRPFLVDVVPLSLVFIAVIGSLVAGIATPTESAALGCVASALAAIGYRALDLGKLVIALRETARISVMILFIIVASVTFAQILAFSGATGGLVDLVGQSGLPPLGLVAAMVVVLLFLGCFVDQVSMLMITIPLFIPIAQAAGIDLLWLGVLYLLAMEISFLTPPFGLLLFVMKGVAPAGITLGEVYRAALPFLLLELLVLALLLIFPQLGTWLPGVLVP
ncbi:TRAP transporter large permease [Piscinibacter sakaiensis]|uniref:TRAP transporter large permease n=1 Tax=Piscinibacter sakaiensis TaxID=1547922 RepID=UPI003AB06347